MSRKKKTFSGGYGFGYIFPRTSQDVEAVGWMVKILLEGTLIRCLLIGSGFTFYPQHDAPFEGKNIWQAAHHVRVIKKSPSLLGGTLNLNLATSPVIIGQFLEDSQNYPPLRLMLPGTT